MLLRLLGGDSGHNDADGGGKFGDGGGGGRGSGSYIVFDALVAR